MKKDIILLEIVFAGSYSVKGAIVTELEKLGASTNRINDYLWVIFTDVMAFDMVKSECEDELHLTDYILADRKTMFVKESNNK